MEMRRLNPSEGPPPGPFHKCFLCTSIAPEQVDTGKGMDGGGVFLCTTCVTQAGLLVGMVDKDAAASLNERIDSQAAEIAHLEGDLLEAGNDAEAVALARRLLAAEAEKATVVSSVVANPLLTERAAETPRNRPARAT